MTESGAKSEEGIKDKGVEGGPHVCRKYCQ